MQESCAAAGTTHSSSGADLVSIDDSLDTVTLATADPSILRGHVVRLGDKGGNTCLATPKGTDLVVDNVVGAVITFVTASSDLTLGDASANTNCVILDVCDLVVNDGTVATCENAGTGSQCTYTAPSSDFAGHPKLVLGNRNPLTLELRRDAPTCVETVAGADATDAANCLAVTALDDATACNAVMTASTSDPPTLGACTYRPALEICRATDTAVCTAHTTV